MRYDDDDDDDDDDLLPLFIGERGLTFYIVISGETSVSKKGIGVVGHLGICAVYMKDGCTHIFIHPSI